MEQEPSSPHLSASALGVLLHAEGSILVVESGDEGVVEGGSVGGSGHEGHEGGLAGIVSSGVTGGKGASVLLEAIVLLVQLLEHLEDDAEVDVGVGNVDFVGRRWGWRRRSGVFRGRPVRAKRKIEILLHFCRRRGRRSYN